MGAVFNRDRTSHCPTRVPAALFAPRTHLHIATPLAAVALPLLHLAKAHGATTSCDLDQGPPADWLPWLDFCFVNHTDLARWLGTADPEQAWDKLHAPAGFTLVVTQGAQGATAICRDGVTAVPAQAVAVLDRTGGGDGDAFDAGYLHALDNSEADRLRCGLELAAQVIVRRGARPEAVGLSFAESA